MPDSQPDNDNYTKQKESFSPWVTVIPQLPLLAGRAIQSFFGYLCIKELAGSKTEASLNIDADINISTGTSWTDVFREVVTAPFIVTALLVMALTGLLVFALKQKSLRKKEDIRIGHRYRKEPTLYTEHNPTDKTPQGANKKEDHAE